MWASLLLCARCWSCWAAAAGCTTAAAKAGRGTAKGSPRCCPRRAPCQAQLWMSSLWRASTMGASSLVGCAARVTACRMCCHAAVLGWAGLCWAAGLRVDGMCPCSASVVVLMCSANTSMSRRCRHMQQHMARLLHHLQQRHHFTPAAPHTDLMAHSPLPCHRHTRPAHRPPRHTPAHPS